MPELLRSFTKRHRTICAVLCAMAALAGATAWAQSPDVDYRIRIEWGAAAGGVPQSWNGSIRLSAGQFRDPRVLSLDPGTAAALRVRSNTIQIARAIPQSYDGLDVQVQAPADAVLNVRMQAHMQADVRAIDIPVSDLATGYQAYPLDEQGNRLIVRRVPGDTLRVIFAQDSLVFAAGQPGQFTVQPYGLEVAPNATFRIRLGVVNVMTGQTVWSRQHALQAGDDGQLPALENVELQLPEAEGVYELQVTLSPRGFATRLTPARPLAERRVQLVAVGTRPSEYSQVSGTTTVEFDPTQARWWERLPRIAPWSPLSGILPERPLGSRPPETWQHGQQNYSRVEPGGWRAFPIPVERIGAPYVAEVEFPAETAQTMAISVVEPDAAGKVLPIGLDSGVDVAVGDQFDRPAEGDAVLRHRLTFWPRTNSPLLLITNLRDDAPAAFGTIRVVATPDLARQPQPPPGGRRRLALIERPLLTKNFSAPDWLEPGTNQTIEDWQTFYLAGRRMCEYLRHFNYDGAAICAASEGSALYPSQSLQPTPRHDRGVFSRSGQDPVRKDVLELLFRLCDREGLRLIPVIEFTTPLPALELLREGPDTYLPGIDLVDRHGQTWVQRHGTRAGQAPYYNPLDPRVQKAVHDVLAEIVSRYSHHDSFDGVAIRLAANGYLQLPDSDWGMDPVTWSQFLESRRAGTDRPRVGDKETSFDAGSPQLRHAWLQWRSEQLARFYAQLAGEVRRQRARAYLYLLTADLVESEPVRRAFRPALPRRSGIREAMLQLGLDATLLEPVANLVLVRSRRIGPKNQLGEQAINLEWNQDQQVDDFMTGRTMTACQFFHEPQRRRLESFDERSPFGTENTFLSLAAHVLPAGAANRQRFTSSLAVADVQTFFEGGWMLPLGQEESLTEWFRVFRQLPARPFRTAMDGPLVVRTMSQPDGLYLYVVNDAPWPVQADIRFQTGRNGRLEPLGERDRRPLEFRAGTTTWSVPLDPYDLVAAKLSAPDARVLDLATRLPESVVPWLKRQILNAAARTAGLKDPPPLDSLRNPSFEAEHEADSIPGWRVLADDPRWVQLDTTERFRGHNALRIQVDGELVTLRSEPVRLPPSGRISLSVHMKTRGTSEAPIVRLALAGDLDGKAYVRATVVGLTPDGPRLAPEWREFIFDVNQLPSHQMPHADLVIEVWGRGTVWLDEIRLFETRIVDDSEHHELARIISVADHYLGAGQAARCLEVLRGYWPRYLLEYVSPAEAQLAERPERRDVPPPRRSEPPSRWQRWKGWLPRWPLF